MDEEKRQLSKQINDTVDYIVDKIQLPADTITLFSLINLTFMCLDQILETIPEDDYNTKSKALITDTTNAIINLIGQIPKTYEEAETLYH